MGLPTIENLVRALVTVHIPQTDAHIHALRVFDDLKRFHIEGFRMLNPVFATPVDQIFEYEFGKTAYSIDNAKPEQSPDFLPTAHGGTQLDRENLLYLVRTSEIAHAMVPEFWLNPDTELIGQLTSPKQHLNTLNEFWWLSRWLKPARIERGKKINPACGKDIDWQLTWEMGFGKPLVINLEVKRRIWDIIRLAQHGSIDPEKLFAADLEDEDGKCKFRPSGGNEINVLGLTLLGQIDREVQEAASKWIQTRCDIDALLLFSRFSAHRSGFDAHILRKRDLLDQVMIRDLDRLDLRMHSRISRPIPFPDGQLPFLS